MPLYVLNVRISHLMIGREQQPFFLMTSADDWGIGKTVLLAFFRVWEDYPKIAQLKVGRKSCDDCITGKAVVQEHYTIVMPLLVGLYQCGKELAGPALHQGDSRRRSLLVFHPSALGPKAYLPGFSFRSRRDDRT